MNPKITTIPCPLCREELKPHYRGTPEISKELATAECGNCGVLVTLIINAVLDSRGNKKKPKSETVG
jgi:transcription elongation factor Elf1